MIVPARYQPEDFESTATARLADADLLAVMGVNSAHRGLVLKYLHEPFPDEIAFWLDSMPEIYRPSIETQMAGRPELAGRLLVLYGAPGIGKTITAIRALLACIRLEVPDEDPDRMDSPSRYRGLCLGHWFDWQDLSEQLRHEASGDWIDDGPDWTETDLLLRGGSLGDNYDQAGGQFLVIDDVSRERSTEYNLDRLQYYLRYRQRHGYPTILTTNLGPQHWETYLGPSLGNFLVRSSIVAELTQPSADVTRLPLAEGTVRNNRRRLQR